LQRKGLPDDDDSLGLDQELRGGGGLATNGFSDPGDGLPHHHSFGLDD
jgi:hypothetical protein